MPAAAGNAELSQAAPSPAAHPPSAARVSQGHRSWQGYRIFSAPKRPATVEMRLLWEAREIPRREHPPRSTPSGRKADAKTGAPGPAASPPQRPGHCPAAGGQRAPPPQGALLRRDTGRARHGREGSAGRAAAAPRGGQPGCPPPCPART